MLCFLCYYCFFVSAGYLIYSGAGYIFGLIGRNGSGKTSLILENGRLTAGEYSVNVFRFELFFLFTISVLNSALFYIREQGKTVPVLSKYLFAPVDSTKIYRAKALLLLRGSCIFFIGGLTICFCAADMIPGAAAPFRQILQQFGYALIFCIAAVSVLLLTDWYRSRHTV